MDVRFSNVVEVTRQYFQGVPPGVGSGPPVGQAPAQRPRSSGASQAVYPPVSLAPSPLPYPNQQNQQRLPSIGSFASGQQRSANTLPPMNQIKQNLSAQDYASYSGRVSSGYKYSSDQQQASAALYNAAISPSLQNIHRQSVSPRTQTSHQSQIPVNGGNSSNHHSASQNFHQSSHSSNISGQPSYTHLTTHQQLAEASQQLALLQAQANQKLSQQLSSGSQNSHPRQSPINSTHQFLSSNQQYLNQNQTSQQQLIQSMHRQELRTSSQSMTQLNFNSRQNLTQHHPQNTSQQHVQQQQMVSQRQQSSSQMSASQRLQSPNPSMSDLVNHHMVNPHSSHLSQISQHQQHLQSSSGNLKAHSVQQNYSQNSSQQISRQLQSYSQTTTQQISRQLMQMQSIHHSVSQASSQQASYQSQHHQTNLSQASQRLTSPSPLHYQPQNNIPVSSQSYHLYNSMHQSRSSHTSQSAYTPSSNQKPYMTSASQSTQNYNSGSSRSSLGMSSSSNSSLPTVSHALTHSRDSFSALTHPHITSRNSTSFRDNSSVSHINIASLITNSIQEGMKSNLPSIANIMSATQYQSGVPNSRPPSVNQGSSQRKNSLPNIPTSVINTTSDSSALNLVNVQRSSSSINIPSVSTQGPTNPSQRSIISGAGIRKESPLDLSVKTVRQSADSTADEEYLNFIYNHSPDYFQRKTPPKASTFPTPAPFNLPGSSNRPVSAPKVDFTPDFSSSHVPKKKKQAEPQQFLNSLPSISSFVKPQLPQNQSVHYQQSGASTSSAASFPPSTQPTYSYPQHQKDNSYHPAVKRPAEEPPSSQPPLKISCDDSWRQSIDRQIENKLNSYLSSKTYNGEKGFEPPQNFRYPQYPPEKPVVNGQADKRVLNILRNSLESREARNKATPTPQPEYPSIQIPTPPRQNVHNLPPFGVINNFPKELPPLDSKLEIVDISDEAEELEPKKLFANGNATNGELDGLAAFLAARIRTKAELKQHVDPGGTYGSSPTPTSLNQNTFTPIRVIKTEVEGDLSSVQVKTRTVSPPKLTKEHSSASSTPRKRDSDSDSEIPPVLERQRKSSIIHRHTLEVVTHVSVGPQAPLPPAPTPPVIKEEDLPEEERDWLMKCDTFIDQLKLKLNPLLKKKKYRKRRIKIKPISKQEPQENGQSLESVIKTEPGEGLQLDASRVQVKLEPEDDSESIANDRVSVAEGSSESELETEVLWQRRGKMTIKKKKPLGDGSQFVPGWEHQVYRYKQSLRMPDSLITIARPTSSLPDLQNYMDSPTMDSNTPESNTPESTPCKPLQADTLSNTTQTLNKEKTILDKLMERFKLNRSEPEAQDANNPYMDYLNKEKRKHRGRSQTRHMFNKKATFKEIFGEERPASAPPAGVGENERKKSSHRHAKVALRSMLKLRSKRNLRDRLPTASVKPKKRKVPRPRADRPHPTSSLPDSEPRTPLTLKISKKTKGIKRKGKSSGFDYLKKKKKITKDPNKPIRKKKCVPMTESEIKEELKTWVLNKESGESILQRASRLGYTEVVQYCLSVLKEKATCKDMSGFTPLHEAASQGHIDIAKLLIDNGASVNQPANGGIRPLHEAAENGFTDLMEVLLRFGADADLPTNNGQTALTLATDIRAKRIIEQYSRTKHGDYQQLFPPLPSFNLTPSTDKSIEEDDFDDSILDSFEIEESDIILPSLYRLSGEPRSSSWVLFHELAPLVRAKTRDSLLRRLGATKQDTRDMRPSDFYANARTRTLTMGDTERKPPKLGVKMSRVTLIRYTNAVKLLLNVETTVIPR